MLLPKNVCVGSIHKKTISQLASRSFRFVCTNYLKHIHRFNEVTLLMRFQRAFLRPHRRCKSAIWHVRVRYRCWVAFFFKSVKCVFHAQIMYFFNVRCADWGSAFALTVLNKSFLLLVLCQTIVCLSIEYLAGTAMSFYQITNAVMFLKIIFLKITTF